MSSEKNVDVFLNVFLQRSFRLPVTDLHSKIVNAPSLFGPIFLIFMQLSANIGQIIHWHPLGEILDPPLLTWLQIRHWSIDSICKELLFLKAVAEMQTPDWRPPFSGLILQGWSGGTMPRMSHLRPSPPNCNATFHKQQPDRDDMSYTFKFLPPANEVWDKVMFSQVFVCLQGGGGLAGNLEQNEIRMTRSKHNRAGI